MFVNGEHKSFSLERHWKSPNPPKIGATVEVILDETGEVSIVTEVPQAQVLQETVFKSGAEISSSAMSALKALNFDKTRISRKTIVFTFILLFVWLFLPFAG